MREEQLKNLGRLLAALDNELSLNTNQLSKAIGTPLAIFPWAIKEASINPKNPGIIQQAIARLDVENAFPPMLTATQQSILTVAYYAERARLSEINA